MQRLFVYAGKYKYLTIASWIFATISAFVALVPFYFIWRIIKEVLYVAPNYADAENLSAYGWSAVGFAILSMLIYIGALICSHLSAFRVQANIRVGLMKHILTLPLGFMDEEGSGKVRKVVNESSAATETYLAHQLPDKCVAAATPIGLAILLFVFDWRLGLLCLIPVGVAFLVMGSMMGENMKKKMAEYQNALEEMSSEAVEYVRGIPVVKTFGQSVFSFKRFREAIKNYEKWTISYTKDMRIPMTVYTVSINAVFAILIAAAFFFGRANSGAVDNTFLLNLLFYIIITPIITVTLTKMMYAGENTMIVEDALMRINGILNKKPLVQSTAKKTPNDTSICFEGVSFRYEGASKDALKNINLEIEPNKITAFIGPSGCGKSTLLKSINRMNDLIPDTRLEGKIFIDGRDIYSKGEKVDTLRKNVGMVFQKPNPFPKTIFENVAYGLRVNGIKDNGYIEETVVKSLKQVVLWDEVKDKLKDSAFALSGGQQQRLCIARALAISPSILLMDEPTSALDPISTGKIEDLIHELKKEYTIVIVTHNMQQAARVSDKTGYFYLGELVEYGETRKIFTNPEKESTQNYITGRFG